jgi:hypothetical protein
MDVTLLFSHYQNHSILAMAQNLWLLLGLSLFSVSKWPLKAGLAPMGWNWSLPQ